MSRPGRVAADGPAQSPFPQTRRRLAAVVLGVAATAHPLCSGPSAQFRRATASARRLWIGFWKAAEPRFFDRPRLWIPILLVWLLLAYVLSSGPAAYAVTRGWIGPRAFDRVYSPLDSLLPNDVAGTPTLYSEWLIWWWEAGDRAD